MTIKKRLARSNIAMFVIPVLVAAAGLLLGMGIVFVLLERVYLPRLGLSLRDLHQTGEQIELLLSGSSVLFSVYAGAIVITLVMTIAWTNYYLTRSLFRHISGPLDILTEGVARIRDGDLDTPIAYDADDEFRPACDAVDEMAARLRASLDAQQREQQKKQELIAGMSHDLKSPLTSIRAYSEALLDGVAADEKTQRRYLETIHAKALDIETLAGRLFTLAKMNASDYPAEPEAIALEKALSAMAGEWSEALDVQLAVPPDMTVIADRELLSRIASNVLGNSKKYGASAVRITAREDAGIAEIAFTDDGPGVPPEQLSKLFDAFYRGDAARTAPAEGSGLGLAVVKKCAETMGGAVRAEDAPGGGLTIAFTLPLCKEAHHG